MVGHLEGTVAKLTASVHEDLGRTHGLGTELPRPTRHYPPEMLALLGTGSAPLRRPDPPERSGGMMAVLGLSPAPRLQLGSLPSGLVAGVWHVARFSRLFGRR